MLRRVSDWLDERTAYRALLEHALAEPVSGGARWAYVFGSVLAFLLGLQALTGILLATYYSPSTTDAWAAVAYIEDQVTLGWLIRGLHSAGASAMVIVLGLHILQTAIWGAYRRPRELTWIVGVMMLGLVLGFALTGYLLPWDQKGYWATQVATGLVGAMPLVGPSLQALLQGGSGYGNLTLTRFFTLHVFVLPGSLVLLTVIHVALMRKNGVTPSWRLSEAELKRRSQPFWPEQLTRDLVAMGVVLGLMMAYVMARHGAELEAPADPTSAYDARPEWYFLPLFELLKLFPGAAEVPAALGAPLLVFATLLALPFLDKKPERSPLKRLPYVGAVLAIFVGAMGLGVRASVKDARSESYQAQRERSHKEALRARELAKLGVPPVGGVTVFENDPDFVARKLFAAQCAGCHQLGGAGELQAPALDGWAGREYIAGLLRNAEDDRFFGKTPIRGMKPVTGTPEELRSLVEYVYSLGGAGDVDAKLRDAGVKLFEDRDCSQCHEVDGTSAWLGGPNLGGWGSEERLREFLKDPGDPRFFHKKNKMPRFGDKLSESEIASLARLLRGERGGH
ncbi:MAG TPA: cytochrome b N-terminal domain-containing protein [Polyangia bacterium]|jgi:ubiquinol-cytochrome c reductase cytochrome b subunit|nr:cytochrome b N-terminal domain-containing protein [Polyangia bacterium]